MKTNSMTLRRWRRVKSKISLLGGFRDSGYSTSTPSLSNPFPDGLPSDDNPTPESCLLNTSHDIEDGSLSDEDNAPVALGTNVEPLTPSSGYRADTSEREDSIDMGPAECEHPHEGKVVIKKLINMNIDDLNKMLFSSEDPWYYNYLVSRKNEDIHIGPWEDNDSNGKTRTSTYTDELLSYVTPGKRTVLISATSRLITCNLLCDIRPCRMFRHC